MAFFKSLVKQHGRRFFEPIGRVMQAAKMRKPNFANPLHLWKLRAPLWNYSKWLAGNQLSRTNHPKWPALPRELREHADFAADALQRSAGEISATMRKHQLKLADRQCRMAELSARVQSLVVILCTSLYAGRQKDELVCKAAACLCQDLTRQHTGARVTDRELRDLTELGAALAAGPNSLTAGLEPGKVLMSY
jgi:hypothetical protein